jgi:hypothetical protein
MFGKKEAQIRREYFWTDLSTQISSIRILLMDEKGTALIAGEDTENKNAPYPAATRLLITRNPQNGDVQLDYLQGDKKLAQEIISGQTISKLEIKFLVE